MVIARVGFMLTGLYICARVLYRCIRLKLYSSRQDIASSEAVIDDEVDFPLRPNGDLDFQRVKLWWGINLCAVRFEHVFRVVYHRLSLCL
jgi:hypothetical protein